LTIGDSKKKQRVDENTPYEDIEKLQKYLEGQTHFVTSLKEAKALEKVAQEKEQTLESASTSAQDAWHAAQAETEDVREREQAARNLTRFAQEIKQAVREETRLSQEMEQAALEQTVRVHERLREAQHEKTMRRDAVLGILRSGDDSDESFENHQILQCS
jgi:hypothetical protein